MNNKIFFCKSFRLFFVISAAILLLFSNSTAQESGPDIPRIYAVEMLEVQPQENDTSTIWYDDFSEVLSDYTETKGDLDRTHKFGSTGRSMKCYYAAGSQGEGDRKVFFGDSPTGKVIKPGRRFNEIYWRIYVKHQAGWTGGQPAKMSRATSIVSPNWNQAMIAHVWGSQEDLLTLDPASGVPSDSSRVKTTGYNDFSNLRWLGNRPASTMRISSTEESGWWVCVEARAKLNTPGQYDGVNQLWIDGKLECERTGMDWIANYNGYGINAVFLESYWNSGSPVNQSRWYDNFVISTNRIGPVVTPLNPMLYKTPYSGTDEQQSWEVELAADREGNIVVWRSNDIQNADSIKVDENNGTFSGYLAGKTSLSEGTKYYARVRQQSSSGTWSDWSRWHQEFLTQGDQGQAIKRCDFNNDDRASIADAIKLLLIQKHDPDDLRGDFNGDGERSFMDVISLLNDIKTLLQILT